jgi:hypothetical protein
MDTPVTKVIPTIIIFILRWCKLHAINRISVMGMCNKEVQSDHLKQGVLFHIIEVWYTSAWKWSTQFVYSSLFTNKSTFY